jgi:hypothetical protein
MHDAAMSLERISAKMLLSGVIRLTAGVARISNWLTSSDGNRAARSRPCAPKEEST